MKTPREEIIGILYESHPDFDSSADVADKILKVVINAIKSLNVGKPDNAGQEEFYKFKKILTAEIADALERFFAPPPTGVNMKKIKGYAAIDFFRKGWRGNDHAIFVYRRKSKRETWMVPVEITVKVA